MSAGGTTRWPVELRLKKAEKLLEIAFDDGNRFRLPAEYLRVESPSAEVQGHGPGQKTLVAGRVHVGIIGLEPIGNYAVRITFDDLHDTGSPKDYQLGIDKGAADVSRRPRGEWAQPRAPGVISSPSATSPRVIRLRRTVNASRPCFSARASLPKMS